jgi:predicted aldo/keto reductase-like oxidoreductase
MGIFDGYFPLGLGTSRFPILGPDDTAGIEKSVDLVCHALDCGVNYIDTSYNYSAGMAQTVLKRAFARTQKQAGVTVKVMYDMDKTADDARRRAELQLNAMGVEKAAFFTCWTMMSYSEFKSIAQKGGIYDGALKLKNEGIVEHICFSTHAPPDDTIKIIESGAFEGMTISFSMLNASPQVLQVLDAALKRNVDVAVMNPLGGGIIAQNPGFFAFARADNEESVVSAAMRFVKAHPSVKIVLSGVSSKSEFDENMIAFSGRNPEANGARFERVMRQVGELRDFCAGCKYCDGCPQDIPVSWLMQKRNTLLFGVSESYNRRDPKLVENLGIFRSHTGEWIPDTPDNPCVRCGQCEARCTQKLKIIDAIDDTFDRAEKVGFSLDARKTRLSELLADKKYKKVGLYPNGGFANTIIELYNRFFGKPAFEWLQFNSDPKMWGQVSGGLPVYSPDRIQEIRPDIIIVCTYKYDSEIYENLRHHENNCVKIVKLHRENDVPWVF